MTTKQLRALLKVGERLYIEEAIRRSQIENRRLKKEWSQPHHVSWDREEESYKLLMPGNPW